MNSNYSLRRTRRERPTQADVEADAMEAGEVEEGVVETPVDVVMVEEGEDATVDEATADRTPTTHPPTGHPPQSVGTAGRLGIFLKIAPHQRGANDDAATKHTLTLQVKRTTMPTTRPANPVAGSTLHQVLTGAAIVIQSYAEPAA